MPVNSKQKGSRGEREAAGVIAEVFGCEARRGQQFAGGKDSPDVIHSIPGVHFEIKRVEKLATMFQWCCTGRTVAAGSRL